MSASLICGDRHLETLRNCGGFYQCPISEGTGERLGPLVGYAGKYEDMYGRKKQWVGEVYANFAMAETYIPVLKFFAYGILCRVDAVIGIQKINGLCAAPIGGYSLADAMGFSIGGESFRVIKAEKKITALATETEREKSKLVFGRHSVEKGAAYLIVEDICNNFSTTAELAQLIMAYGGTVAGIACFLNRSVSVSSEFALNLGRGTLLLPVISLVRLPINEWRQDDPAVAEDIVLGNVVWKPKDEWGRLMAAM